MSAQERIADSRLEPHDRLPLAVLVANGGFALPLTQDGGADALGPASVHVNRILHGLREEALLVWSGRNVRPPDAARLRRLITHPPTRVSARW